MTAPPAAAPAPAGSPWGRRGWLVAGTAGWAVLLLVLAYASARTDRPTVPEQQGLAATLPTVDRAAGELLAAVGAGGVVEIGPLDISRGCRLTPVRAGARAARDITVHVRAGTAPALLDRVAAALPAGYRAGISHTAERVLRGDAGDFVAVRGAVESGAAESGAAVVRLRASTGCRPAEGLGPASPPVGSPPVGSDPVGSAPGLTAALSALALPTADAAAATREVPCPAGRVARTVAVARPWSGDDLALPLRELLAGVTVVRAEPGIVAYRRGAGSIVVSATDGTAYLAATTGC